LHERLRSWLDAAVDTPLLAGWVYLLLTLAALVPAWRRCRAEPRAALAMALLASGLGYFLSLPLLSGSAEFRYLNWMILASLLGSLLLFRSGGAHRRD
jgi:predicted permease